VGQNADDMVEGFVCAWCGQYFEQSHGYPVLCRECWKDASKTERRDYQKASEELLGERNLP